MLEIQESTLKKEKKTSLTPASTNCHHWTPSWRITPITKTLFGSFMSKVFAVRDEEKSGMSKSQHMPMESLPCRQKVKSLSKQIVF